MKPQKWGLAQNSTAFWQGMLYWTYRCSDLKSKQQTCRRLSVDLSSAICWSVVGYLLICRPLSVNLSRLSVDMSSTTSWSAAGYKCEFGFPTAWKTDGSYVKPVFQPLGKLLRYRRNDPALWWGVRHETSMGKLWIGHKPVVESLRAGEAVTFILMKTGWTR